MESARGKWFSAVRGGNRLLPRRQHQEARKGSPGREPTEVADEGEQSGGSEHSDCWNRVEEADERDLSTRLLDLPVDGLDSLVEGGDVVDEGPLGGLKLRRHITLVKVLLNCGQNVLAADAYEVAELAQQAAERVDLTRAVADPAGANPVLAAETRCGRVLMGTERVSELRKASRIALASARSFLVRWT